MTEKETTQIPADSPLEEELADEDVAEMANLTTAQTGVPGTIFISTAMGRHGPRVKYFLQPGRSQPSFSVAIADTPTVVANSLSVLSSASRRRKSSIGCRATRMRSSISGITATTRHSRK